MFDKKESGSQQANTEFGLFKTYSSTGSDQLSITDSSMQRDAKDSTNNYANEFINELFQKSPSTITTITLSNSDANQMANGTESIGRQYTSSVNERSSGISVNGSDLSTSSSSKNSKKSKKKQLMKASSFGESNSKDHLNTKVQPNDESEKQLDINVESIENNSNDNENFIDDDVVPVKVNSKSKSKHKQTNESNKSKTKAKKATKANEQCVIGAQQVITTTTTTTTVIASEKASKATKSTKKSKKNKTKRPSKDNTNFESAELVADVDTTINAATTTTTDILATSGDGAAAAMLSITAALRATSITLMPLEKSSVTSTSNDDSLLINAKNESLRWEFELDNEQDELNRLKLYKMNRRKRYIDQRNKQLAEAAAANQLKINNSNLLMSSLNNNNSSNNRQSFEKLVSVLTSNAELNKSENKTNGLYMDFYNNEDEYEEEVTTFQFRKSGQSNSNSNLARYESNAPPIIKSNQTDSASTRSNLNVTFNETITQRLIDFNHQSNQHHQQQHQQENEKKLLIITNASDSAISSLSSRSHLD